MSVRYHWSIVRPNNGHTFSYGTSSDEAMLKETFGDKVSTKDIPTLRAMHRVTTQRVSLWLEIANTLERLQGDNHEEIVLKVWPQY